MRLGQAQLRVNAYRRLVSAQALTVAECLQRFDPVVDLTHVKARRIMAGDLDPALEGRQRPLALVGGLPARPRIAVVGSRAAHRAHLDAVPWIVQEASERGWSLVSGGALGIDAAAHRAALEAGVPQVAVLPCGPDRPYPPDHSGLFDAMARSGAALLFAQPSGTVPARAMFASRNALVVALCDAVVVVEAGIRSGTMLTGRLALRKGVTLGAVLGSRGSAALVAAGARPLPVDDEPTLRAAVAHLLGSDTAPSSADPWPSHLRVVRDTLRCAGARGAAVGMLGDTAAAMVALAEAEALGLVAEVVPGRWVAVR
jgi:DNA protecting protein DprA